MLDKDYEQCREHLENLVSWYRENEGSRNEATTRLHMIDDLFFSCLGWTKDDAVLEEPHGPGFADYTFLAPSRLLVVEAKREGAYFELPVGVDRIEYSLVSLMRDIQELKAAITQVSRYAQSGGIPFAAVTNGHQLVSFVANRVDGSEPLKGKALVFSSLEQMLEQFPELWNALSKSAIEIRKLQFRLVGEVLPWLPAKLSNAIATYPGIKGRNIFQTDLQIVSDLVLEDIIGSSEIEKEFLENCYCQSGALSQHSLNSREILKTRYAQIFDSETTGPTTVSAVSKKGINPDLIDKSLTRRPIALVGDIGVGKTSFIRHFMCIDAEQILDESVTFYIDLGTQATLTKEIEEFIIEKMMNQLLAEYEVDIFEDRFVRSIYHNELERMKSGIFKPFLKAAPDRFLEEEIKYLADKVNSKVEHLRLSLEHLARSRRKQIILFLDNADQRDDQIQQKVFLIAQEFAENWPMAVFLSLRPETFYDSLRHGTLGAYHPKAFTIEPPRIDYVVQKRLRFALKLASGDIPVRSLEGTSINLHNLEVLIKVFLSSLERNDDLYLFIDNISAGNVRIALDLVKGFLRSGHVDTEKIIRISEEEGRYWIPIHEFLRAIAYGDAEYYDPNQSRIANIFDVSSPDAREHFILGIAIEVIAAAESMGFSDGFMETARAYEYLQGLGFVPEQIDAAMRRGHRGGLIQTVARRIPREGERLPHALRATSVGKYHVKVLSRQFAYLDAVIIDTPVLDDDIRGRINNVSNINERLDRTRIFKGYLDEQWNASDFCKIAFDWVAISKDLEENITMIDAKIQART